MNHIYLLLLRLIFINGLYSAFFHHHGATLSTTSKGFSTIAAYFYQRTGFTILSSSWSIFIYDIERISYYCGLFLSTDWIQHSFIIMEQLYLRHRKDILLLRLIFINGLDSTFFYHHGATLSTTSKRFPTIAAYFYPPTLFYILSSSWSIFIYDIEKISYYCGLFLSTDWIQHSFIIMEQLYLRHRKDFILLQLIFINGLDSTFFNYHDRIVSKTSK